MNNLYASHNPTRRSTPITAPTPPLCLHRQNHRPEPHTTTLLLRFFTRLGLYTPCASSVPNSLPLPQNSH